MPSSMEDYEVLSTIGSGSYGKCQRIRRKSDGKILAWKQVYYGNMAWVGKQMLVSEVNLLRELKHPNIVAYCDRIIDRKNTTLYIVMEFCEGGDLATLLTKCIKERRYLEEDFILHVIAQLSLALKQCHGRKNDGGNTVLHRDLKPANIFLDAKQNVKLGDFGFATILQHDTSFVNSFVGSPYYMSPEQMNRMPYNEKSDIWSLGCLLYELCALSPPFTAKNRVELAKKITEGTFDRIPYQYSNDLNTLLCSMLHLKDYMRPSVESIVQSSLISTHVAREQKRAQAKLQRWSCDLEQPKLVKLKLKEQALRQRERHLKEREQRFEQREQELCIRERIANEKLARAEILMKYYNLMRQQRAHSPLLTENRENKLEDLRAKFQQVIRDCNLLCFTDTWLNPAVPDHTIQPAEFFSVHRMDRTVESVESEITSSGMTKARFADDCKESVWREQRVGIRSAEHMLVQKLHSVNIGGIEMTRIL